MTKSPPLFLTITGLDEKTDLHRVQLLSARYRIEWGVLFSPSRQGNEPRYPTLETISRFRALPVMMSGHLCGAHARNILNCEPVDVDLDNFERIQVNCVKPDYAAIAKFAANRGVTAITQHRELTFPNAGDVALLYDCSGGRGDAPKAWPVHPGGDRVVGYAGGINPSNISDVLDAVDSSGYYWLDMESGVRTDDWLDLDKVEVICEETFAIHQYTD